jgi:hypothetical protein
VIILDLLYSFLKKNVLNKWTKKSLDDCNCNEEYLCTQWTNELYMCVRGTLFLVRDDEVERDSQLIGHGMTHSIQVRYEWIWSCNNKK